MKKNINSVNPIITLVSDFGDTFAQSQIELEVYKINPEIKFIVGANDVTPFSILEGSFVLTKFSEFCPKGSYHIVVIDPGVGSERSSIIIETNKDWYVGPDNGVLYNAAHTHGILNVYKISESSIEESYTNTFHGRDIFAKTAALLSTGIHPTELGSKISIDDIIKHKVKENQITHIDAYGNVKISNDCSSFKLGNKYTIEINNNKKTVPYVEVFDNVHIGEFLLYKGSHDTLELAQNQLPVNKTLDLHVGDVVSIA